MYNSYIQNGVIIAPNVVAEGKKTTVKYKGLLYNSDADAVSDIFFKTTILFFSWQEKF